MSRGKKRRRDDTAPRPPQKKTQRDTTTNASSSIDADLRRTVVNQVGEDRTSSIGAITAHWHIPIPSSLPLYLEPPAS
ncbi:hypothetical protein FRB95_008017 [Tulasnella sp. JGI-2019a]|nr:hypothetical protein FRB95_008017 [Tulasnella sp. JGI-2019a]